MDTDQCWSQHLAGVLAPAQLWPYTNTPLARGGAATKEAFPWAHGGCPKAPNAVRERLLQAESSATALQRQKRNLKVCKADWEPEQHMAATPGGNGWGSKGQAGLGTPNHLPHCLKG